MSCYHPLKAFVIGKLDSGKNKLKICSYETDHVELDSCGKYEPTHLSSVSDRAQRVYREFVQIPCGQCIGCRIDYSRQWANRCLMELQYHESAYFVTLTYDDVHVPITYYSKDEDGCAVPAQTLRKRDLQLFFKRLRTNTGQDIRYFCCGEYGSRSARPHYHCIIFGLVLDDLIPYKRSHEGFQYYNSETVQSAWRSSAYTSEGDKIPDTYGDIGFAVVADVTWESCAYTARYVTKKATGYEKEFYDTFNLEPEFAVMSRKPGIGRKFYDDHKEELYEYDHISIKTPKGGRKVRPPRYFDQLFDVDDPDTMSEIKDKRKTFMDEFIKMRLSRTSKSYLEMLADDEANFKDRIKGLQRSEI